jgi:hypothetical protein
VQLPPTTNEACGAMIAICCSPPENVESQRVMGGVVKAVVVCWCCGCGLGAGQARASRSWVGWRGWTLNLIVAMQPHIQHCSTDVE